MWTKTAIYQQSFARPRWTASLSGTTRGCSTWMPESCEQNAYSRGTLAGDALGDKCAGDGKQKPFVRCESNLYLRSLVQAASPCGDQEPKAYSAAEIGRHVWCIPTLDRRSFKTELPQLAFDMSETIMDLVSQQSIQSLSPVMVFAYTVLIGLPLPDTTARRWKATGCW
ncbi:hypothetical protein MHU86_11290 [Fragilaria crotonensis]|nr:hypothetical protein MHU86_11290 [Fragilaria crotonensis]